MKVISSRWNFAMKYVLPLFWIGFMVLFFATWLGEPDATSEPVVLLLPLPFIAVGVWFFYKLIWPLADRVEAGGEFLLVRRGSTEQRITYSEILNAGYAAGSQPARLSLRLRKAGPLGDEVLFIPVMGWRWSPMTRNPVVESLIYKVDAAKRAAP